MTVTLLGSGAWEGIPAPRCLCPICRAAKQDPQSKDARKRPQLRINTQQGSFGVEISPDIRFLAEELAEVNEFLVSHWHFDHLYGLLELHAQAKFVKAPTIYCSKQTQQWLEKHFSHIPKHTILIKANKPFTIKGVQVTPLPLRHSFAQEQKQPLSTLNNTMGFIITDEQQTIAYLADYFTLEEEQIKALKGVDILFMDGTYLFEELYPKGPLQDHEKHDPDHMHGEAIISLAQRIGAKKTIFHSISHLNGLHHQMLQALLPDRMFIGYDNMTITT